ncbi:MAG: heavy metal-binding domain-containing protein [Bacteroidales bacterium]|nr:heavy metal-binding domain-containing protein [Bacteroidales bacterium]
MAEFILKALVKAKGLEGRPITEYKGVVFGEVISGVNFLRDFAASIRHGRQAGMK